MTGAVVPRKTKAKASKTKAKRAVAKRPRVSSRESAKKQFLDSFAREHATTLKVLRAFPPDQAEFRPHVRSKSARELAWMFVSEQKLIDMVLKDQLNVAGSIPPAPPDLKAIIDQFERDFDETVGLLEETQDAKLDAMIQFPVGPGKMGDWTKLALMWFMLSDQIHHRGQFSLYVRLAGGKVPSIYGPSADEPWR
jgi:uncharacterized damage-inducible protein DinB